MLIAEIIIRKNEGIDPSRNARCHMCGIVGYVGRNHALPLLIESLKKLEYRGYDSAGIACQNGKGLEVYKTKGKIDDLRKILPDHLPDAMIGLGHTRWATHGEPSTRNAHPHSIAGVAVVHNGIIENYLDLKAQLLNEGCDFCSDTDTEVVPQMISKCLKSGLSLIDAIRKTIAQLHGSFALGIMSESEPGTIVAVRSGSPLVIGLGDGEFFFSSDIPAILPYTKKFIFLEDGQFCVLREDEIQLYRFSTPNSSSIITVEDKVVELDWAPSMAEKGGYDHFMLKEIYEQPRTIRDTMAEWIRDPERLLDESGLPLEATVGLRRLQIVACGTSYHAALIGKYAIESFARVPVDVEIASEYRYRKPIIEKGTLLISISQSGETADTLAAQREAKQRGATTFTICNVAGSTASREADSVLYTKAGPEIGVASTKTFTAQMAALYLFAIALGLRRGKLRFGEANVLKTELARMPDLLEEALQQQDSAIREMAKPLVRARDFLYLARGVNYPIALEGALKLKEISYIHAEGYAAGEMKHGPIALITPGLPVVTIAPHDHLFEKVLSNMEEVKARRGQVIVVTDDPEYLASRADHLILIPASHAVLSPFVTAVPLQLLAYHIGVLLGCDVDQPRNLAKSVTVE